MKDQQSEEPMLSDNPADWLTVREFGLRAKAAPKTVRKWIYEGVIVAEKRRRRMRLIHREELAKVITDA